MQGKVFHLRREIDLQTVVVRIGFVGGLANELEPTIGQSWRRRILRATNQRRQVALGRQIDLRVVVLVPVLISYIGDRQHRFRRELSLHANAVLIAYRLVVLGYIQTSNACRVDRFWCSSSRHQQDAWVFKLDAVVVHIQAEGNVGTRVVHVIPLDSFVHHSEPTSHHGGAVPGHVVSETNSWTEVRPMIVDQSFGHTILSRDTNSVQVERYPSQYRVRAGSETWTGGINRAIGQK